MIKTSHHIPTWVYWVIQSIVILVCMAALTVACSQVPQLAKQVNPWELAHQHCSKLENNLHQKQCHLGVAVARDACDHGVDKVECSGAVDPTVCHTINETLKALCAPTTEDELDKLDSLAPEMSRLERR